MRYSQEELNTIIQFLDSIGNTSFVSGFRDGLHDYRNWLIGEMRPSDPANGLVATSCYMVGLASAESC